MGLPLPLRIGTELPGLLAGDVQSALATAQSDARRRAAGQSDSRQRRANKTEREREPKLALAFAITGVDNLTMEQHDNSIAKSSNAMTIQRSPVRDCRFFTLTLSSCEVSFGSSFYSRPSSDNTKNTADVHQVRTAGFKNETLVGTKPRKIGTQPLSVMLSCVPRPKITLVRRDCRPSFAHVFLSSSA